MISIITPTHDPAYLMETYRSVRHQSYDGDWEWILVADGCRIPEAISADEHVRVIEAPEDEHGCVGALKRRACEHASGGVVVELDHDDLLTPDALSRVAEAFEDPEAVFAYSNTAEFHDGTWEPHIYSPVYGWETRPFRYEGHDIPQLVAWPPCPQAMRRIYWAPNHLRAWRAGAYWGVGGHNPQKKVMDDHDLMCRLALRDGFSAFRHIDDCLYLQRMHNGRTCSTRNAEIQLAAHASYRRYVQPLAQIWAADNGLHCLDLGGGIDGAPYYETVDIAGDPDITADLQDTWPFADDSVGVLRASHVLEHLPDPIHTMREAHRVLAPGGFFLIEVPSTDGRGAWQDPTHCSFWNEHSFRYYTDDRWARYLPDFRERFQVSLLTTETLAPHVPVVRAHLIALKPPYTDRPPGKLGI